MSRTSTNCATHSSASAAHRRAPLSSDRTTPSLQARRRQKLRDLGVDHLHALVAGYRDAVVAVLDEVLIPDLVQGDRRQLLATNERPVHPLPLAPQALLLGHEVAVELPIPAHAPHYTGDLDLPPAQAQPTVGPRLSPYVVEREQLPTLPP